MSYDGSSPCRVTPFRIIWTHLWVCLWDCFQRGLTGEARPPSVWAAPSHELGVLTTYKWRQSVRIIYFLTEETVRPTTSDPWPRAFPTKMDKTLKKEPQRCPFSLKYCQGFCHSIEGSHDQPSILISMAAAPGHSLTSSVGLSPHLLPGTS